MPQKILKIQIRIRPETEVRICIFSIFCGISIVVCCWFSIILFVIDFHFFDRFNSTFFSYLTLFWWGSGLCWNVFFDQKLVGLVKYQTIFWSQNYYLIVGLSFFIAAGFGLFPVR